MSTSEKYKFEYCDLVNANELANKHSIIRQRKMIADIRRLDTELEKLKEGLGLGEVFPVVSCLEFLVEATDHLLNDHNCDVHGYEQYGYASAAAKKHLKILKRKPIILPSKGETDAKT